jgi:hypothetical protein
MGLLPMALIACMNPEPTVAVVGCLYMPNRQPRAGPVELPLFPSRSPQKDPRPQVGPTVRIHFPPAASQANFELILAGFPLRAP